MTDERDPFIESIARELRQPVRFDSRFDERVMAALEPEIVRIGPPALARPWYRRRFAVSAPLGGLAAAAAVTMFAVGSYTLLRTNTPTVAVSPGVELVPVANVPRVPSTALQNQQFIYLAPQAKSVALVGQFNDWVPAPMAFDSAHGAWSLTVPLAPGRYEYQYLIDGVLHTTDPTAPQVSSDFSSPNSVVTVVPKE